MTKRYRTELVDRLTPEANRINEVLKKKARAPIDATHTLVSKENRTEYDASGMSPAQRALTTTVMMAAFGILSTQPATNYSQAECVPTTVTQATFKRPEPLAMRYGAQDTVVSEYFLPQYGLSAEQREALLIERGVRTNIERLVAPHRKKQAPQFQDSAY